MTAWDLIERYMNEYGELPLPYSEATELEQYALFIGVDPPEPDSIVAIVQMLRQRQQEALREAGQMTLI